MAASPSLKRAALFVLTVLATIKAAAADDLSAREMGMDNVEYSMDGSAWLIVGAVFLFTVAGVYVLAKYWAGNDSPRRSYVSSRASGNLGSSNYRTSRSNSSATLTLLVLALRIVGIPLRLVVNLVRFAVGTSSDRRSSGLSGGSNDREDDDFDCIDLTSDRDGGRPLTLRDIVPALMQLPTVAGKVVTVFKARALDFTQQSVPTVAGVVRSAALRIGELRGASLHTSGADLTRLAPQLLNSFNFSRQRRSTVLDRSSRDGGKTEEVVFAGKRIELEYKTIDPALHARFAAHDSVPNYEVNFKAIRRAAGDGLLAFAFEKVFPQEEVKAVKRISVSFANNSVVDVYYRVTFSLAGGREKSLFVGMPTYSEAKDMMELERKLKGRLWNYVFRAEALEEMQKVIPEYAVKPVGAFMEEYIVPVEGLLHEEPLGYPLTITEFIDGLDGVTRFKEATRAYAELTAEARRILAETMAPYIHLFIRSYDRESRTGLVVDDMSIINVLKTAQGVKIGDVTNPSGDKKILKRMSMEAFIRALQDFHALQRRPYLKAANPEIFEISEAFVRKTISDILRKHYHTENIADARDGGNDVNSWTRVKKLLRRVFGAVVGMFSRQRVVKAFNQISALITSAPVVSYAAILAAGIGAAVIGVPMLLYVPVLVGAASGLAVNVRRSLAGEATRFTFGVKVASIFEALAVDQLYSSQPRTQAVKTDRRLAAGLGIAGAVIAAVCLPGAWLAFGLVFGAAAGYFFPSILRVSENFFVGAAKSYEQRSRFAAQEDVRSQIETTAADYQQRYAQASTAAKTYYLLKGSWAKFSLQNPLIAGTVSFLAMRVTLALIGLYFADALLVALVPAQIAGISVLSLGWNALGDFFSYVGLPHTIAGLTRVFFVTMGLSFLKYIRYSKALYAINGNKAVSLVSALGLIVLAPAGFVAAVSDTDYGRLMTKASMEFWTSFIGMWIIGAQIGVILQLAGGIGSIEQLGVAGDLVQLTAGVFEQQATSWGSQAVTQTVAAADMPVVSAATAQTQANAQALMQDSDTLDQPVVKDQVVDGQGHVTKVVYADDSYVVYDYVSNLHADVYKYNAQDQLVDKAEADFIQVYIVSQAYWNADHTEIIYPREYWATRIEWTEKTETFSYSEDVYSGAFVDYATYTKHIYQTDASGKDMLIAEETYDQHSNPNQLVESKIYDTFTGDVAWTVEYPGQAALQQVVDIDAIPSQVRQAWQQAGIDSDTMLQPAKITDASGATWMEYRIADAPAAHKIFEDRQGYNIFSTAWDANSGEPVFSYKATEDNQVMATLEAQAPVKGSDLQAMMDKQTGLIWTKTTAELLKEQLGIDIDAALAQMGVQDATEISVVKETPFQKESDSEGVVTYSDQKAMPTTHYKLPNDPQGRDVITIYPDKNMVISSWYEARAGPAGVLPKAVTINGDGTIGEVKVYTGEENVNGVPCHVYSVSNAATKTAEYRTSEGVLYRVDYDRIVLSLANIKDVTAGKEIVYYDLNKPYEAPAYATDENGAVIKQWQKTTYDNQSGVETQIVREEDPLVSGKWNLYEYKHDLRSGELLARNQLDMFKDLFYQAGPLPVWAWLVLGTAGFFLGLPAVLKKIFMRLPSVRRAPAQPRNTSASMPTQNDVEAAAAGYGFDREQVKAAALLIPNIFEGSSRSADEILAAQFESFKDWLDANDLHSWLEEQGIELTYGLDEMVLFRLVYLSSTHMRSITPGWRYYLYVKALFMRSQGVADVGSAIVGEADVWYLRMKEFYTGKKFAGEVKEMRMTYEDVEDIFNGRGEKDFVRDLLESGDYTTVLDAWAADPKVHKTYRDQFGWKGVLALGKTCWIFFAGMGASFAALVALAAAPAAAPVLLVAMTVAAGLLIGYALYQPGRAFKRILENNPGINGEAASRLKKLMIRQNISAISFWTLVFGSKLAVNFAFFTWVMSMSTAVSGFGLAAFWATLWVSGLWLPFVLFFVLDIFTFYYIWQYVFSLAKGYSLGLGRITSWKQLRSAAPAALEAYMQVLGLEGKMREDVSAALLSALAEELQEKGLLGDTEAARLAAGDFTVAPQNKQAGKRIVYFFNTLMMDLPYSGNWDDVPSLSVAITAAAEKVKAHLNADPSKTAEELAEQTDVLNEVQKGVGLTKLTHLIRQSPDEWARFIDSLAAAYAGVISAEQVRAWKSLRGEEAFEFNVDTGIDQAVRDAVVAAVEDWANLRFQALYRTIHGLANIWSAYEFLVKNVYFPDRRDDEAFVRSQVARKLQLVLAYQNYGKMDKKDLRRRDIDQLQKTLGCFDVVYLDEKENVLRTVKGAYTAPAKHGIHAQYKPMNQNNFMTWLTNDKILFFDANCDMRFEDALKLPNLLQEFNLDPLLKGINMPEYIFTEDFNWIGQVHGFGDRTWTTFVQRFLAMYGADGFYGHGAVFDREVIQEFGVLSPDYVSEDLMMAMKVWLKGKGYRIEHKEYIQAGKAREVSVPASSIPFNKFAEGAAELLLGRQFKRMLQSKEVAWYQKMNLFFTLGFYLRKPLVVFTMFSYISLVMVLGVSGFAGFPLLMTFGLLGILFSQVISFTGLGQMMLEKGIVRGALSFCRLFPRLLLVFPYYVLVYANGVINGFNGKAAFIVTKKSWEIEQSDFQAKIASLYDTKTKLAVPFLAAAAISCFLWQALPVVYSILFMWMVFSWVFTPMISAPGLLPGTTSFIEAGAQRSGYRRWLALWFDYLKTQVYGMRFFRLYDVAIALMAAGAMVIFGFPVTFALFLLPVSAFGVMGIILAAGSAHFALQAVRPAGSRDGGQEYVLIKLNADMSAQEKALVNNFYQADDRDVVGAQALNNAASRDMRFAGHSLFARLDVRGNESFASIARNVHTVLAQVCAESYPNCCYPAIGLLADLFAGVEGIAVEPRLISVCDENGISRGFHFYAVVQDSNNDRWLFDPTAEQFNGLHEEFASRDGGQVMKVKSLMVGWMRAGNALVKRFVKRVFGAVVGMFSRSYRINGQRFWFVENVRVNPSAVTLIDVARAYAADEFDLAVRGFVGIPESYRERLVAITVKFDTVKPAGRP